MIRFLVLFLLWTPLALPASSALMYGDTYFNGRIDKDGRCTGSFTNLESVAQLNVYGFSDYYINNTPIYNCTKRNRCTNTSDFSSFLNTYSPTYVLIYIGGDCINQDRSDSYILDKIKRLTSIARSKDIIPVVGNIHRNPRRSVTSINNQLKNLSVTNNFYLLDTHAATYRHNAVISPDGYHMNNAYFTDATMLFGKFLKNPPREQINIAPIIYLLLSDS